MERKVVRVNSKSVVVITLNMALNAIYADTIWSKSHTTSSRDTVGEEHHSCAIVRETKISAGSK